MLSMRSTARCNLVRIWTKPPHRLCPHLLSTPASTASFVSLSSATRPSQTTVEKIFDSAPNLPFYTRPEMESIQHILQRPPRRIELFTGPANSGKTMLLRQALSIRQSKLGTRAIAASGIANLGMYCMDLRGHSGSGGADEAAFIFDRIFGGEILKRTSHGFRSFFSKIQIPWTGGAAIEMRESKITVADFLERLLSKEKALRNEQAVTGAIPIVFIDQADRLQSLFEKSDKNEQLIDEFLKWLANLASSGIAHVFLASSDPFFHSFLGNIAGDDSVRYHAVGDLKQNDALGLISELAPALKSGQVDSIYSHLGGRISSILVAVETLSANNNLNELFDDHLSSGDAGAKQHIRAVCKRPVSDAEINQVLDTMIASTAEKLMREIYLASAKIRTPGPQIADISNPQMKTSAEVWKEVAGSIGSIAAGSQSDGQQDAAALGERILGDFSSRQDSAESNLSQTPSSLIAANIKSVTSSSFQSMDRFLLNALSQEGKANKGGRSFIPLHILMQTLNGDFQAIVDATKKNLIHYNVSRSLDYAEIGAPSDRPFISPASPLHQAAWDRISSIL